MNFIDLTSVKKKMKTYFRDDTGLLNVMKKTCCILCVLLLAVILTSCAQLHSHYYMKDKLLSLFPDAVITDTRDNVSEEGLKSVEYTVKNHDVTFTVTDSQYYLDTIFGSDKKAKVENDYAEKLSTLFKTEITRICKKYNVTSSIEAETLNLSLNINQLSDIDNGLGAMEELLSLLGPYLPTEAINKNDCDFNFLIKLESTKAGGWHYITSCARKEEFNFEDERKCLRFNTVDSIKSGECTVSCTQEDLDMYPPKEITTLKIDGVPFTSDLFPIEFTYDILSEEYQTIVCYGTSLTGHYGESGDDYLQREIIQSIYPQANYVIHAKEDKTTYQIGKDQYLIKYIEENDEDRSFEFYKNGAPLNIETKMLLNHLDKPECVAYFYISVEDFAELMGMKVDSINKDGICLSVK